MLRVLNSNFNFVNQIREYTFSQYEERFREIGTFKVIAKLTESNFYLFDKTEQYYIMFDLYTIGKVDKIQKDSDSEYDKTITITGRLAPFILTQRVINKTITFKGTTAEYIKTLIEECFDTSNVNSKRYLKMNIVNKISQNTKLTQIDTQVTGGYLWDEIQECLESDKLGVSVYPSIGEPREDNNGNKTNVKLWNVFIKSGIDRRIQNAENNSVVIFSQQLSNINRTSYERDVEQMKNVAYVAGEGEGTKRKWYEIDINESDSISNSGLNRSELWIDARDIQSDSVNGSNLTQEQYDIEVKKRANEKALENNVTETYSATVRSEKYEFRKDYNVGDWVTVKDTEFNIIMDAQIIGVTVSEQDSLKIIDIEIEYGTYKKNIQNKTDIAIKRIENAEISIRVLDNKEKTREKMSKQGSYTFHGINNDSVKMFTKQDIDSKFGITADSTHNYVVLIMNGDAQASGVHITGASWEGDNCFATFDRVLENGSIRINFIAFYIPTEDLLTN